MKSGQNNMLCPADVTTWLRSDSQREPEFFVLAHYCCCYIVADEAFAYYDSTQSLIWQSGDTIIYASVSDLTDGGLVQQSNTQLNKVFKCAGN
jgi:hypothetical protein